MTSHGVDHARAGREQRPSPQLDLVYGGRFSDDDERKQTVIWKEIVRHLQRYVPVQGSVLDLGCGSGFFIRTVRAAERWASDLRDVSGQLPPDVHFLQADGLRVADVAPREHFDLVFISNYLEHLPSPDAVIEQLAIVRTLLKRRGRVLILQPNIRLVGGRYWDFIDHRVALTERSLEEAARVAGFRRIKLTTRFLPYTTKSRLPRHPLLVRAYLACPAVWLLLGKQSLYLGERAA